MTTITISYYNYNNYQLKRKKPRRTHLVYKPSSSFFDFFVFVVCGVIDPSTVTAQQVGPLHLAVARPLASNAYRYVISDEHTEVKTLQEYGLRFDIEENFLDDKSNGFQLISSLIRSSNAWERRKSTL